ncbi:DUF3397 domain-containing protein [Cytobacillus gottheilii]|uniref:DUF3397 domain-containing protein n=1 Tax=Cytobacillus gottheilii TaxID=859144 RepID=A0ABX8FGM6_9BACI|nr:DUF3397 domain-containing protein [Cytobacillus gottheilii]QVY63183.1 DUF3397 domain-containing protein [Cytobacillus gottheilii]
MDAVLSGILATFVTLPIVGYIIVFIAAKQLTKRHKLAVKAAVDISTFFLIVSVHFLILAIWEQSFLWMIIVLLLLIAALFTVIHWRVKHEINFTLVFRGFWRFNFLLFLTAYIVLMAIGLIKRVSFFVS